MTDRNSDLKNFPEEVNFFPHTAAVGDLSNDKIKLCRISARLMAFHMKPSIFEKLTPAGLKMMGLMSSSVMRS